MPVAEESVKSSWADEVEEVEVTGGNSSTEFPHPIVKNDGNSKTITEVVLNEDDKKVKVISHYKIEKHRVAKSIAQRKTWKKFGLSENDKPGPNPATTIGAEEVQMQDDEKDEEPAAAAPQEKKTGIPGKYVPPSMREGGSKKGESMVSNRRDETATVRVTNLSENTREQDLQELFRPFGEISRIFLAKDKFTMASKGFAFINYKRRDDAARAIQVINGFGYDHLILNVEWAK
ncbi:Eukaryotic translation initiation factor 3 subunit G [Armadillidium vulgare]|nr:Eukaryotic translation initiation factor 3 subunit G [Armadillidium vulgare]